MLLKEQTNMQWIITKANRLGSFHIFKNGEYLETWSSFKTAKAMAAAKRANVFDFNGRMKFKGE